MCDCRCTDTTYRFWRKADWITDDVDQMFRLNEDTGHVRVMKPGVYLIYVQVIDSAAGVHDTTCYAAVM